MILGTSDFQELLLGCSGILPSVCLQAMRNSDFLYSIFSAKKMLIACGFICEGINVFTPTCKIISPIMEQL